MKIASVVGTRPNFIKKMDNFAQEMAKEHPRSLSEAILAVRTEEDESL